MKYLDISRKAALSGSLGFTSSRCDASLDESKMESPANTRDFLLRCCVDAVIVFGGVFTNGTCEHSSRQCDNASFSIMEACSISARGEGSLVIGFSITKS